jgi:hypothetical protein
VERVHKMSVFVGGRVPRNAIAKAAYHSPLGHGASKSQVMRYVFARGVGYSEAEALKVAYGQKASTDARDVVVRLPDEIVEAAEAKFPGRSRAWILRYLLAIEAEVGHEQAEAIASDFERSRST